MTKTHYLAGDAVEIFCEIDQELVAGTTVTLESLIDPDGTELLSTEAMEYGTEENETHIASMVWQSTEGVDPVGKYHYIVKALNGITENFMEGDFYLRAR